MRRRDRGAACPRPSTLPRKRPAPGSGSSRWRTIRRRCWRAGRSSSATPAPPAWPGGNPVAANRTSPNRARRRAPRARGSPPAGRERHRTCRPPSSSRVGGRARRRRPRPARCETCACWSRCAPRRATPPPAGASRRAPRRPGAWSPLPRAPAPRRNPRRRSDRRPRTAPPDDRAAAAARRPRPPIPANRRNAAPPRIPPAPRRRPPGPVCSCLTLPPVRSLPHAGAVCARVQTR